MALYSSPRAPYPAHVSIPACRTRRGQLPMANPQPQWKPPCSGLTDLFFVGEDKTNQIEKAKKICRPCQKRIECLCGAILRSEQFGVFGGMSVSDRMLAGPFVEQQYPQYFASRRTTLRVQEHQTRVDSPSLSDMFCLEIHIQPACTSASEEKTPSQEVGSQDQASREVA
jgi:hypothetical protein